MSSYTINNNIPQIINQPELKPASNKTNKVAFKGLGAVFYSFAKPGMEVFSKLQDSESLSWPRFIQDTSTNALPKSMFARSLPDLLEMNFMENLESLLFYFAPAMLGGVMAKTVFKHFLKQDSGEETLTKHLNNVKQAVLDAHYNHYKSTLGDEAALQKAKAETEEYLAREGYHNLHKNGKYDVEGLLKMPAKKILGLEKASAANGTLEQAIRTAVEGVNKAALKKRVLPVKAGLILTCVMIPMAEYSLCFLKNLFTLGVFKTADFSKVTNLNKNNEKEDPKKAEKLKSAAKRHLTFTIASTTFGIAAGLGLAAFGNKSPKLQKLSEFILEPGEKLAQAFGNKLPEKIGGFFKKYLSIDFASLIVKEYSGANGRKLSKKAYNAALEAGEKVNTVYKRRFGLSSGQLFTAVLFACFGYGYAANSRGKLDLLETLTRIPLTATYVVFGSSMVEGWLTGKLKGKPGQPLTKTQQQFQHLFDKDGKVLKLYDEHGHQVLAQKALEIFNGAGIGKNPESLGSIAKNPALKREFDDVFKGLFLKKTFIHGAPYLISMLLMGIFVSAMNRVFTKLRYNSGVGRDTAVAGNDKLIINPQTFLDKKPSDKKALELPAKTGEQNNSDKAGSYTSSVGTKVTTPRESLSTGSSAFIKSVLESTKNKEKVTA